MKIFGAKAQKLARVVLRVNRSTGSRERPDYFRGRTIKDGALPDRKSYEDVQKDGGALIGSPRSPYTKMAAPVLQSAKPTLKMAPPGPELSPDHTNDGSERPPCLREASVLLPDLRPDPDPRPAPAAPSRRAASRSGDRAGRSAVPGPGGRFVGGGRRWQPPLGVAACGAGARTPGRHGAPVRSAPLPLAPPSPPRSIPPCPGDAVGAASPPSPIRSDPRRQIRRRTLQEIVPGDRENR
ncbi:uncharacterized protein LOC127463938 isoform X3 [Manacus candei]|uniref:uncharacterized protein LOC127463938 isoform X3 n=1 Tax=Manacus candei TaxID=415023 RepID=UPI00222742AF|nr:uncharacterized protein LOC127463938 isoform X3 [Manacus candei]